MAVTPADSDEAFLREVDENLRRDQVADLWRRYGRIAIAALVAALAVLAGVLWWNSHRASVAGQEGEQMQAAFDDIAKGNLATADASLAKLATSRVGGYRAAALLSQAAVAVERKDDRSAIAKLAAVAGDTGLAQPYRDVALVKQTALEFDTLTPQTVIARLQPLAVAESAFFGSAGEMVAISYLRLNRRAHAGSLFAAIAKQPSVPATIRQRAVQMANGLGIDAVAATDGDASESGTK